MKTAGHIFPFFWQHGESPEVLRTELERIRDCGIGGFCVEARPHPDFAGPRWWQDMDLIMDFARQYGMQVWLLDDDRFPTGHVTGIFDKGNHPLANRFLASSRADVLGPIPQGALQFSSRLPPDAELVGIAAFPRKDAETSGIDPAGFIDLTGNVEDGWIRWDVPPGLWRIFTFYSTCKGNGKVNYFNILDSRSVKLLLDMVYEPHYARYRADFGKTFQGFFSDEPEFGNLPGYDFHAHFGPQMIFIPWSGELQERLRRRWGPGFLKNLPALWYDGGSATPHIRYEYMDETTKQLALSYSRQVAGWCGERGVLHIGHIIEDDNAHGRLGCSTGHYFRALSEMAVAGIDVVHLQIMPGMNQVCRQWYVTEWDGEFFHYGLAKLGASLAHIDPKKQGRSLCEIYGAYGWQAGIGLMKWLTDHMLAGGINNFVPHAFSPKLFPDPDCPPHFYAGGKHPQYPVFQRLMGYADRAARLLSDGRPLKIPAVLYHAEAEWAGEAMLYQKPMAALLKHQIDCDVIPADILNVSDGKELRAGIACYSALIIPRCTYIPLAAARFVERALGTGFPVFFVEAHPQGICENMEGAESAALVAALQKAPLVSLDDLADTAAALCPQALRFSPAHPDLRLLPYERAGGLTLFCFNESVRETVSGTISLGPDSKAAALCRYDPWEDRSYALPLPGGPDSPVSIPLSLLPGEAAVFLVTKEPAPGLEDWKEFVPRETLDGEWTISARPAGEHHEFAPLCTCAPGAALPDLSGWAIKERFCGTLRYQTCFNAGGEDLTLDMPGGIDAALVYCNGEQQGVCAGNPARTTVHTRRGENILWIDAPLTPAWSVKDRWTAMVMLTPPGILNKPRLA